MNKLRFTLLTDGSSDQALLPILEWIIKQHCRQDLAVDGTWAELAYLPQKTSSLTERMVKSAELFPCDVLFVHRDAEGQPPECRYREIDQAQREAGFSQPFVIPVVPVRMQEAWLLFDADAIRSAAGNPNGTQELTLPCPRYLETLSDPKEVLNRLLSTASGLHGRRLKDFSPAKAARLIPQYCTDFAALRTLAAFRRCEDDVRTLIEDQGW